MSTDEIKRIREHVYDKFVDGGHGLGDMNEQAALAALRAYRRTTPIAQDGETYQLGILFFELAFSDPVHEKEYLAHAKVVLEEYRARTGEEWDVVDDRIDDLNGALKSVPPAQLASLVAAARAEYAAALAAPPPVEEKRGPVIEDGMVLVAAGPFLSGPGKTQRETKAYWIDVHPVTNANYRRFCEITGYRPPKYWTEGRLRDPDAPVVGISWYDAYKFTAWAGKSLPSKDQWEKAARGRSGRVYPWGDEFDAAKAAFGGADPEDLKSIPAVGKHAEGASEWGAQDMSGLVWEWTDSPDPNDPEQKVICGGSWCDGPEFLRCDEHLGAYPKDKYDNIGFRCIRLAKE
ncbi:MAG: formylglycine-generating enzyme family protein [Planctomycetes bacterium]|nr:formylglycine-generating enzyme family protein [Planctomycetota bacterium]